MKLNCKEGDLAMVVRSVAGNEGKIVRCVKFLGDINLTRPDSNIDTGPGWETDPPLISWSGKPATKTFDSYLRPINDPDGVDEMIRIAGKPREKTKPVVSHKEYVYINKENQK